MRILFLSSVYPRRGDRSCGTFCQSLAKSLAPIHQVHVISPLSWIDRIRQGPAPCEELEREVTRLEYPLYLYPPKFASASLDRWMWSSLSMAGALPRDRGMFDMIVSYWAHPDGTVAVRLAKKLAIPVGVIVGGSDVLLLTKEPSRKKRIVETLMAADAVFAVGENLRDKIVELGVAPHRVHLYYQGVDPIFRPGDTVVARQELGLPCDQRLILWVGRMVPVKGLEVLMKAFEHVTRDDHNVRLVLVGQGPERPRIEAMVRQSGLANRVQFVGALSPDALPDWYRAADLFALASFSEGIPNVLRESLACGTPIVATDVGGVRELASHPSAILVPPNDPVALANAILQRLRSPVRIEESFVRRGWLESSLRLVNQIAESRAPLDRPVAPSKARTIDDHSLPTTSSTSTPCSQP